MYRNHSIQQILKTYNLFTILKITIMKTSTLKTLFVTLVLALSFTNTQAQLLTSIRIDVQGSRYSDQMWVFSVASCSRYFDNGWDGYKMFGTSVAPQIFALEPDGIYQVDAVPDLNNTNISFWAGEDTTYTFSFNNENLSLQYTQLYLIDLVANKTIDIFASGTKYTFNVQPSAEPVNRFKIVTVNPNAVATVPPVVVPADTVVVVPPVVIVPPVTTDPIVIVPPVVTDPIVITTPVATTDPKNKDCKDKKDKKVKLTNKKNVLVVENSGKQKGKLSLYSASSGRKVKDFDFNANGTTNLNHNLPKGTYVVKGATSEEEVSENIIVQ